MIKRGYDLSAAARLDLLHIWNYLADRASLDVADAVAADIEAAIRQLVRSIAKGHHRPDLTDRNLLFYLVHSYYVIYRTDTTPLHVVRVLHSSRDVKSLLAD